VKKDSRLSLAFLLRKKTIQVEGWDLFKQQNVQIKLLKPRRMRVWIACCDCKKLGCIDEICMITGNVVCG